MDEKEGGGGKNPALEGMNIAVATVFLLFLIARIATALDVNSQYHEYLIQVTGGTDSWYPMLISFFQHLLNIYVVVATILSFLLILALVYTNIRIGQIEAEEKKQDETPEITVGEPEMNAKWQKVQAHVNSDNPAEWRLAILEADVMLEEMLEKMSYHGTTLGEKLKSVEKSDFITIEYAWEAHKIRNAIAHEGADFLVTQREAKRVIGLFEKVFREFYFI